MIEAKKLYQKYLKEIIAPNGLSQEFHASIIAACIIAEAINNAKDEIIKNIKIVK